MRPIRGRSRGRHHLGKAAGSGQWQRMTWSSLMLSSGTQLFMVKFLGGLKNTQWSPAPVDLPIECYYHFWLLPVLLLLSLYSNYDDDYYLLLLLLLLLLQQQLQWCFFHSCWCSCCRTASTAAAANHLVFYISTISVHKPPYATSKTSL